MQSEGPAECGRTAANGIQPHLVLLSRRPSRSLSRSSACRVTMRSFTACNVCVVAGLLGEAEGLWHCAQVALYNNSSHPTARSLARMLHTSSACCADARGPTACHSWP